MAVNFLSTAEVKVNSFLDSSHSINHPKLKGIIFFFFNVIFDVIFIMGHEEIISMCF